MKGGVGKTTISINLATLIKKELNKKVIILDFNRNNNQTLLFVGKKYPIINGRLYQGIIIGRDFHLKIIHDIYEGFDEDLKYLEKVYDYIIFDIPNDFSTIMKLEKYLDIIFLVITPDTFSIYPNYILYESLGKKDNIKLILNKYDKEMDIDLIEDLFDRDLSVVLRYDKKVKIANMYGIPLYYMKKSKFLEDMYDLLYVISGIRIRRGLIKKLLSIFE